MKAFKISRELPPKILSAALFLIFILPYILFFKYFTLNIDLNISELLWALKNSLIQSVGGALFCVVMGAYFALGLFQFPLKAQKILVKLVLLPQILPSLFSILIAFSIVNPFPMGHLGVIFIFILVNLGFSSFQFYNAIQEKVGQLALVSEIYGIGRFRFYRKVLLPLLWPDIKLSFTFVFLFSLSSLSIPLVAGGGKGTNLEVLIFEKIFIDQNWSTAWFLMLLQSSLVFGLSYFFLKNRSYQTKDFSAHRYTKSKLAAVGVCTYLAIYIGGYLYNLAGSLDSLDFVSDYISEIQTSTFKTLEILMIVLIAGYFILLGWVTDYVQRLKHNMAINLISVSTVLVGFAFYLTFPQTQRFDLIKIPLAFVILFSPGLFKMFFEKRIDQMKMQIFVAKTLGIPKSKIIYEIIFKQLKHQLFMAVSLLTIWSLSDFAILRSLGTQTQTLGLMTQSFLTSYRLEAAYLVSFYILMIWFILSTIAYFVIEGFHVDHKKH